MKKIYNVGIEDFKNNILQETYGKKVVVWGASTCALELEEGSSIKFSDYVEYFVDISKDKQNKIFQNVIVKSPEELYSDLDVDIVIIATQFFKQVEKLLSDNNFNGSVYNAYSILHYKILDYKILEENIEEIYAMLSDEKSRNIVDYTISNRKNQEVDYSEICEENQYFVKDIVKKDPNAIFIDAGAFNGDTIQQFIEFQDNKFDKIYSFELDEKNYKKILEKENDDRVKVFNYGLWDKRTTCFYKSDEGGSIIGEGDIKVECVTLDEIIADKKVTFIKMDIEGAELKALYGAEKCIKRCKPQLAICVYHRAEDIYVITKLIHEWLPEHKLYIRHHNSVYLETVLYAIPQ